MKKVLLLFLTLLVMHSCQKNKTGNSYEIHGSVKNIPDSSIVYLSKNNKVIDSTIVINETFKLNGKVNAPTNVFVDVKNTKNYKSFWLENNIINFYAEAGKFEQAKITGSTTQLEEEILEKRLQKIERKMEALENEITLTTTKAKMDSIKVQYNQLIEKREVTVYQEYVNEFPQSLVSAKVLRFFATTWGKEKTKALFTSFSKENKNSDYGKRISRYLKLSKEPKIGEQFVDLKIADTKGEVKQLSSLKGKVVLLKFWASSCDSCRKQNLSLIKTYHTYASKGFEIFAVSLDQYKKPWLAAIEEDKLPWIHVSDLSEFDDKAVLIYGVNEIPDNFLIDKNGVIIGRNLRGDALDKKLAELFQ